MVGGSCVIIPCGNILHTLELLIIEDLNLDCAGTQICEFQMKYLCRGSVLTYVLELYIRELERKNNEIFGLHNPAQL